MSNWIKAADINDFNHQVGVLIKGHRYALFKVDGEVYATDDICPHEYSLLSEGEIWDGEVYCVKHGSRFDIKTGKVKSFPATRNVKTYPAKVEGTDVLIEV